MPVHQQLQHWLKLVRDYFSSVFTEIFPISFPLITRTVVELRRSLNLQSYTSECLLTGSTIDVLPWISSDTVVPIFGSCVTDRLLVIYSTYLRYQAFEMLLINLGNWFWHSFPILGMIWNLDVTTSNHPCWSCLSLPCYRESHGILRVMHKPMYVYKWPDYGDSHQRHQKWSVAILSKLECELYLIWKYERKDEYLPVYILMFINQLNRIKYSQ